MWCIRKIVIQKLLKNYLCIQYVLEHMTTHMIQPGI